MFPTWYRDTLGENYSDFRDSCLRVLGLRDYTQDSGQCLDPKPHKGPDP